MTNQYNVLPNKLVAKAVVFGNELAWPAQDALKVIDFAVGAGCAISGVELWQECDGHPQWIATSDYTCEMGNNWMRYKQCCANGATLFVQRFAQEPGALFNLSWYQENETFSL